MNGDFPGDPVPKTSYSLAGGPGSISGQGARSHILQLKTHVSQGRSEICVPQLSSSTVRKKCQQGHAPSETLGRDSLPLPVSGGGRQSLAFLGIPWCCGG